MKITATLTEAQQLPGVFHIHRVADDEWHAFEERGELRDAAGQLTRAYQVDALPEAVKLATGAWVKDEDTGQLLEAASLSAEQLDRVRGKAGAP